MWAVIIAVVIIGFVVAAIFGALHNKQPSDTSLWGSPTQAKVLVIALVVLGVAVVWAIHMNNV